MQDTLLRVLVVAVGLLTNPMNDPGVEEEWDERDMQKFEERLLKEEEKLYQEMAPVSADLTHSDDKGNLDDVRNIQVKRCKSDQRVIEKGMSDLQDLTIAKQDLKEDGNDHKLPKGERPGPNCPQMFTNEAEHMLETSEVDLEVEDNLQLDMKQADDIKTDGSFRDSNRPEKEKQEAASLSDVHAKTLENETSEAITNWGKSFLCYLWNAFSIISMVCFFRKFLKKHFCITQDKTGAFPVTCIAGEVPLPDSDTLLSFHSQCVQGSSKDKWRKDEILEGFANDLLEAMRTLCNRNGGMVIGDFHMEDAFDINVPFTPQEPYSFQCLVWNNHASDLLPDMQVCGQIKMVENKVQNGCHCQSTDADDDMVCLLHSENEKVQKKRADVCDGLLCSKNTPFLSKSRVTRWFRSTIKQAWGQISHKYEFELNIHYIDAPGALVIRFRSGKKIAFRMNPVVKFNTDAYFYIIPCTPSNLDTFWTLSLTSYENHLLQYLSKGLPDNSCHIQTLEIACFLHRRQTALSGSSIVKNFHFKTALMHLLLTKDPSQWKPNCMTHRLQDLMDFMGRSLVKKHLQHVIIGNPLTQKILQLPAEFTQAKPVNLFHPLVVHDCIFRNAMIHFQEMLRNAHMLIQDYVDQCNDSTSCC